MQLTNQQLKKMGFNESHPKRKPNNLPVAGYHLIVYHRAYGITFGFYCGSDVHFVLPFVEGFSWATHWKYHCRRTGSLTL